MSDPEAIVSAVTADPTLHSLIDDRIYPQTLPAQAVFPAITYMLVSQPTLHSQEGAKYRWPRWRFRIWAERYADLVGVADALSAIFEDHTRSPFSSSWIDGSGEGQEPITNRHWRFVDVLGFQPGGATQ